jgi:hypothetical protein
MACSRTHWEECNGIRACWPSILRDEIKNEPEDTVRAKLMVHADQFELLVMLL